MVGDQKYWLNRAFLITRIMLFLILFSGCSSIDYEAGKLAGYAWAIDDLKNCTKDQVDYYGDLCAEARDCQGNDSSDYCTDKAAKNRGFDSLLIENHFEGVKCAAESVQMCME